MSEEISPSETSGRIAVAVLVVSAQQCVGRQSFFSKAILEY
jgi:hypothetical protein